MPFNFRSLGLNTVTAYQRAKVSALKIVGLRIGNQALPSQLDVQVIQVDLQQSSSEKTRI